ncbi:hypothetical protein SNK03_13576 [Fusarium graminearum]|uniref:Chromosome 1, complete genome n=1 Tax=Gibberella zeae (strain ATCC MYA-4620 / CBS 123657 / FGSC 9075 / NRRL 31084 / PH-1) TaxID=229533 RepID=I1SA40_GIBZE|nr:hypothetical protein FGSG_13721 [Fusarium graminearum PH-1]ESU16917.1 hypothetical protein FGSG_13721 [Fusarium graminearum PH-1]CEF75602.1 unnamed protein product [Fusarium graminearum]CZS78882.1 unnamed protein product [Fusarium graminearum]|eukprot:XP_011319179.1 hypothetical protein FGSG_13721 [Fusarium graminearum PH-1]
MYKDDLSNNIEEIGVLDPACVIETGASNWLPATNPPSSCSSHNITGNQVYQERVCFVVSARDGMLCVEKAYVRLMRMTAELLLLKSIHVDGAWLGSTRQFHGKQSDILKTGNNIAS